MPGRPLQTGLGPLQVFGNPPASLRDRHLPLPEKRGGRGAAAMDTRPRPRAPRPSTSIGRPLLPDLAAGPPLPAGR